MRWFTTVHDSEEVEPAGGGKAQAAGGKSHCGWKRKARGGRQRLRFRVSILVPMVMRRRDPGKLRSTAGQFLRIQRGIVVRRNLFNLLRNFRENGKTERSMDIGDQGDLRIVSLY